MKRLISSIVIGAFLTTSTSGLAPNQISFLAAPSPMETPTPPAYVMAAPFIPQNLDPTIIGRVKEALQKAVQEATTNGADIYEALLEAVRPFIQKGSEQDLAVLVVQAYNQFENIDESEWDSVVKRTAASLKKRSWVGAALVTLASLLPLPLASCASWGRTYPATLPAVIAAADRAYDYNDLSALKVLLRDTDRDIRLQAARILSQIVDDESRKRPADRQLNLLDLGRELVLRIPAETEYPTRHLLIEALAKVLELTRGNQGCAEFNAAATNLLLETYFLKREQIEQLRVWDTQMEESRAQIQNREVELQKIELALQKAGKPITFASLFDFLKDVAARPVSDASGQLQNSVIAELIRRAQVPTEGAPEGSRPPVAGDVASLVGLYSMDRFASDAQGEANKIWRLDILRHLSGLVSPGNAATVVPLFLAALNKEDPYKEAALNGILRLARQLTPQSTFQGQAEMVTAVVGILNNPQTPSQQKTIAAQILNALRSIQAANGLRVFLASKNDAEIVTVDENLAQAYLEAVGINAEAIRTAAESRRLHGATLIRLLAHQKPAVRTAAVRTLGQITETQNVPAANDAFINAVLLDELRAQRLLDDTATAAELREPLQAEIRAIQEVLPRLGFQNDYASLKARVLDLSADANVRAAMLIRIGRLLGDAAAQNKPDPATVANDLRGLLNDAQREVVIQTLRLLASLPPATVNQNAELVTAIIEKATPDIRDYRIPALTAIQTLNIAPIDSARAAVLNRLTDEAIQEDEKVLRLNIMIGWGQAASGVEDQRIPLEVAAITSVTALAQDATQPPAVRDRAVEVLLVLAGSNATKERLQELLALVRDGGQSRDGVSLQTIIQNRIAKSDWNEIQRAFYSSLIQNSGQALATYLETNVPRVLNGPAIAAVLSVRFQEVPSAEDKITIALAKLRMNNTEELPFLLGQITGGTLSADKKAAIRLAIATQLGQEGTPIAIHQAVLSSSPHDPELDRAALARLAREASPATVPILLARLPDERNPESIALIAESLARGTTDQQALEALKAALSRFDELAAAANITQATRDNLKARLMAVIIELMGRAPSGGKIGRGDAEIHNIWLEGPRILTDDIQKKLDQAKQLALDKLKAAEDSAAKNLDPNKILTGNKAAMLRAAKSRIESGIKISALPIHVERKSPDKKGDLFLLGNGTPTEALLPLPLFDFEAGDAKALERLARVLVHELVEGAKQDILTKDLALRQQDREDPESFHRLIIELENAVFPDSDLPQVLPALIQTKLKENARLDAISLKSLIDEARARASAGLTDQELEAAGKTPEAVQAAIGEALAGEKSTPEQKIAAELILPRDYASPLMKVAVAVTESDALIALDAAVLDGKTSLPEWLLNAVRAGRVVFFGSKNSDLVDASAFVANPTELEGKAKAHTNVTKVVVMLTPSQMRVHYADGYGARADAVNGKDAFVAPLNPAHSLVIHLALAQELIGVNFDVSKLSEAGKLLLALQLDSLDISIGEMRSILSALGQIPTELIRDLKKKLLEGLIDDVLKAA